MHGASLFSSADISWEEFVALVTTEHARLSDSGISAQIAPLHHEIGLYRGKEIALVVWKKRDSDPEMLLEEASQMLGSTQKTLIIIDMNSLDLAQLFARVFAAHFPCVFQFGGHYYTDNQEFLA